MPVSPPIGAPGGASGAGMIARRLGRTLEEALDVGRQQRVLRAARPRPCRRCACSRAASSLQLAATRSRAPARWAPRAPATSRDRRARAPRRAAPPPRTASRPARRTSPSSAGRSLPRRPGSDGSTACCATMRAARSSCSTKPIVTSAAIVAGRQRIEARRPSSAGTARGAGRSPADAAGSRRESASARSAPTASASPPARRAPCADWPPVSHFVGVAAVAAHRVDVVLAGRPSTRPIPPRSGDTCRSARAALRSSPSARPLRIVCSPRRLSAARRTFISRFSSSAWFTPFDH